MDTSQQPRVTVIVPVFNGEPFLIETITSLLAQEEPVKILAYDDSSSDRSLDLLKSVRDSRITVVAGTTNVGLAEAFNTAVRLVDTEFVARNDQDDISLPHRFRAQLRHLDEHPEAHCVFSNYIRFGQRRELIHQAPTTGSGFRIVRDGDGTLLASSMCGRTSRIAALPLRPEYYPADDLDFELRLTEQGIVHYLSEPLVRYRMHSSANSYLHFKRMQERGEWAMDSHRRRGLGLSERTLAEFLGSRPTAARDSVVRNLRSISALRVRRSGQAYLDGRSMAFSLNMALAAVADPRLVLAKVTRHRRPLGRNAHPALQTAQQPGGHGAPR